MAPETALILSAWLAFEIKHFLCDFALQTAWQVRTKGIYGHPGGLVHAGIHLLGSVPVLMLMGVAPASGAMLLAAEFLVHYHMDWVKANVDRATQWGFADQRFWILFGFDQLVHQLTYLGMVYVVVTGLA